MNWLPTSCAHQLELSLMRKVEGIPPSECPFYPNLFSQYGILFPKKWLISGSDEPQFQ